MESTLAGSASAPDRTSATLALLQQLLADGLGGAASEQSLRKLLDRLVVAMRGTRAGLHLLPQLEPIAWTGNDPLEGFPWESAPTVLDRARESASAIAVPEPGVGDGGFLLCVLRNPAASWLFWLHDTERSEWEPSECATWALAGSTLLRWLETRSGPRWAEQLERALRQEQMENANMVVCRLAHDYGNIFTSLLGFSELSLAQHLPANSPLHRYLTELHQSAQAGSQLTHRLRLLSRRQAQSLRSTPPAPLLLSEEARFRREVGDAANVVLDMPTDLPSVAIDAVHLQAVLGILLDNAREAVSPGGTIRVTARPMTPTAEDCLDYYGTPRPVPSLEIRVVDDGPGLSEVARQRLFRDPFFTSKSRKGGFGLATAYGLLASHQGGLRLIETPGQPGLTASVLVPLAAVGLSHHGTVFNPLSAGPGRALPNERVLVVDDDQHVLRLVCTTLEQAGYKVQTAASAEEARGRIEGEAGPAPFSLVLTDVRMPHESGVDLVRGLLAADPGLRFLFMTARPLADFPPDDLARDRLAVLPKPFLPETLLLAVRDALDRPLRPGPAASREAQKR